MKIKIYKLIMKLLNNYSFKNKLLFKQKNYQNYLMNKIMKKIMILIIHNLNQKIYIQQE